MKEPIQHSLDQTGIAIYINTEGKEKRVPLFSEAPMQEANEILFSINTCMKLGAYEIKHVFIANNLLDYKIYLNATLFKNPISKVWNHIRQNIRQFYEILFKIIYIR